VFFSVLVVVTIVTLLVGFALGCLLLGFDTSLSWAVDLVPFSFAVISVFVSVKKLRDEHHNGVIVFVLLLGLAGTVVIHYSKARADANHHDEMDKLDKKLDSVGRQNGQLLSAVLKPALTPGEAEVERKQNIEKALRSEYILSHDNISPGLLAGTEFPPTEWMNKRLQELGEKWTIAGSEHTAAASESNQKADLGIEVVYPTAPAIDVFSLNHVMAHEVKEDPVVWDLDGDLSSSLQVNEGKYDWLRSDQHGGPVAVLFSGDVKDKVKPGHRIFGFISVTCPLCKRVRTYWIYFAWGEGGWYAEIPERAIPISQQNSYIPADDQPRPGKVFVLHTAEQP
jgi:hypothetical protein